MNANASLAQTQTRWEDISYRISIECIACWRWRSHSCDIRLLPLSKVVFNSCQERTEKAITTSSAGKVVPGCLLEMILNRDRSTVSRADQHKVQGLTRPGVKDTIDREALPCTGNAARDEDRIRTWLSRFATLTFRARSGHLSTCCACSTLFHAHRYGALKALLMRTV